MKKESAHYKKTPIPIIKGSKKLPKGAGWTAQDIRDAVEEMLFTESVGEALQTARKTRKLTGESLGKRVGVGRSRISQLEHKTHDYDLSTLYRVLDALDYDLKLSLIPREGGKVIVVQR
jgi:ribosome-binding protein aMBF1 (putative translation factor)